MTLDLGEYDFQLKSFENLMSYEIDYVKLLLDPLAGILDELFLFLVPTQVKVKLPKNSWSSLW